MDCSFLQVCTGESQDCKQSTLMLTMPVGVGPRRVMALLDSGCGQTLIQQGVVSNPRVTEREIRLQYIHGDVRAYRHVRVLLTINGVMEEMTMVLAHTLAYTVILGQDWLGFSDLLREASLGVPPPTQVALEGDPAGHGDTEAEEGGFLQNEEGRPEGEDPKSGIPTLPPDLPGEGPSTTHHPTFLKTRGMTLHMVMPMIRWPALAGP